MLVRTFPVLLGGLLSLTKASDTVTMGHSCCSVKMVRQILNVNLFTTKCLYFWVRNTVSSDPRLEGLSTDWLDLKTPLDLAARTPVSTPTTMEPGLKKNLDILGTVPARTRGMGYLTHDTWLYLTSVASRTCFKRGGMTTQCLDDCPTDLRQPPSHDDIINMVQV